VEATVQEAKTQLSSAVASRISRRTSHDLGADESVAMLVRVGDGRSPRDHPSFAVTVGPLPPDAVSPVMVAAITI